MALFLKHKLQLAELFKVIPEEFFSSIARNTQVDYYSKVLHGKLLFYLLLHALLTKEKLGQRGIADLYASPYFRLLFDMDFIKSNISHSCISERLSKVEIDYFRQIYEEIYPRFSLLYPSDTIMRSCAMDT